MKELDRSYYLETSPELTQKSLIDQYHEVIVKSLITTFGLDYIFGHDQYGGHVDTVHNARKIKDEEDAIADGKLDPQDAKFAGYNNKKYQKKMDEHQTYNKKVSSKYHQHSAYIATNRQGTKDKKLGIKKDGYTGKTVEKNAKLDLDHIISAKEIHEDGARFLIDQSGEDLANMKTNLEHTNRSINRSKGAKTTDEYIKWLSDTQKERRADIYRLQREKDLSDADQKKLAKLQQLESIDRETLKSKDNQARQAYNQQLNQYYVSKDFIQDTFVASTKQGWSMGGRQAIGLVLFEVYQTIREELPAFKQHMKQKKFDLQVLITEFSNLLQKSVARVKTRFRDVLISFKDGMVAGILSSLTTTLINIFTSTAKNIGKLIRELWVSIVESLKILIFNPEKLGFGQQLKAIAKIIATAISTSVGTLVFSQVQALALPFSNLLATFAGALVTGLMSVSIIYYLDHSEKVSKLVAHFDRYKGQAARDLEYYEKINEELNRYAAELEKIPLDAYEKRLEKITRVNSIIQNSKDDTDVSFALDILIEEYSVELPYDGTVKGLDDFMNNPNSLLVFK